MFQIADLLAIVAGAIAGAIAFLPFVFTLKPVLDDKQNADMLKGMVSLAVSAVALLVFTLVVFALFGEAFRMFLLGEAIGFVVFMAACQATAVSTRSQGRQVLKLGVSRRLASCSTAWCFGPSSPRPMESWV